MGVKEGDIYMTKEQELMVKGAEMFLNKFKNFPMEEDFTKKDILNCFNEVYDEITTDTNEDTHVNLFKKPMTEQEQLELSDLLDKFSQMYDNGFEDQLTGDKDGDSEYLIYEFKQLFNMVDMLTVRALDEDS